MRSGHSLRQTRHVLRLMGRRMTIVHGSTQVLEQAAAAAPASTRIQQHARFWSSSSNNNFHNNKSSMILTSKKNDGGGGGDSGGGGGNNNNNNGDDRKSVTTTTQTPPSTGNNNDNSGNQRDVPRRIVVKKSPSSADSSSSSSTTTTGSTSSNKQIKQKQRIGYLKRRFPLHNEIVDTNNKTIWIPPKPIVSGSTTNSDDKSSSTSSNDSKADEQHYRATLSKPAAPPPNKKRQQLAQIRAGAWLDAPSYCKGGGASIAGTEAARKLLRGKKDLIELLGYAVHSGSGKQSLVLQNHGIPRQVLQHHVDYAAQLLLRLQAQEVSFKQFNQVDKYNSVASDYAVKSIRQVLVRDAVTGENQVIPWPLAVEDEENEQERWVQDLALYWTVMNRIATRLGVAVLLKRPGIGRERQEQAMLSSQPSNSMLKTPPHYWKVEFHRELHFDPEQLPPAGRSKQQPQELYPVLEFTPLKGVASPGHCRIRLQGVASSSGDDHPLRVSLSFDACFRMNPVAHAQLV